MAGTTINPYRFGGQLGYRRDGANRNYVRARHLDTQRGRWTSSDPIGFAGGDNNLYRYAGNNSVTFSDSSGLAFSTPCTHNSPPSIPCCAIITPACVAITNNYAASYNITGNHFTSCASCVSSAICDVIVACEFLSSPCASAAIQLLPPGLLSLTPAACLVLGPGLQCQNSCMASYWLAKTTPLWKRALAICKIFGTKSIQCCQASILAEQDGYTKCTSRCGLTGAALQLLPYPTRIAIANNTIHCCK